MTSVWNGQSQVDPKMPRMCSIHHGRFEKGYNCIHNKSSPARHDASFREADMLMGIMQIQLQHVNLMSLLFNRGKQNNPLNIVDIFVIYEKKN